MPSTALVQRVISSFAYALILFSASCNLKVPSSRVVRSDTPSPAVLSISDAPTYAFGTVVLGASSSIKTLTLTNSGGSAATSLSASLTGPDIRFVAGTYPGFNGTCGASLAGFSSCTITVIFTPQTSGSKTDTLSISYSSEQTETLTLSFTGTAQTPASLAITDVTTNSFGTVVVGATANRSFTVTNTGQATANSLTGAFSTGTDYSYAAGTYPGTGGDCGSTLNGASTCTIVIQFVPTDIAVPTTPEVKSDTIQINYDSGIASSSATRSISGTANAAALLTVNGGAIYDYGTVNVSANSDHTFTVTNSGGSAVSGMSGAISGGTHYAFTGVGYPGTAGNCGAALTTTGSCSIEVRFAPLSGGTKNDTVVMSYNNSAVNTSSSRGVTGQGNVVGGNADSGQLDTTFNTNGIRVINLGTNAESFKGVDFYGNGSVALAGNSNTTGAQMRVGSYRMTSDGALDTTFNTSGSAVVTYSAIGARDITVDSSGRAISIGGISAGAAVSMGLLLRRATNGSLDTSFKNTGKMAFQAPDARSGVEAGGATGVVIDTAGRIVSIGYHTPNDPSFRSGKHFTLHRHFSNGTVDTSFHSDGFTLATFAGDAGSGNSGEKILIQADGKIVASGTSPVGMAILRLSTGGTLDTSFKTNGKLVDTLSTSMVAIVQQTDGNFLGVSSRSGSNTRNFAIARYLTNGNVDTSFDTDGKKSTDLSGAGLDTSVKVMLGTLNTFYIAGTVDGVDFGVAKYLSDGAIDTSFATSGSRVTNLAGTDEAFAAQISGNSPRLCVVGSANSYADYAIACYVP